MNDHPDSANSPSTRPHPWLRRLIPSSAIFFATLAGVLLFLAVGGCAARGEPAGMKASTFIETGSFEATEQPEPFPFFREAPLPADFPEPGPAGKILVKRYPAHRAARIHEPEGGDPDGMFMPLFQHIKKRDIPMTAPVEMTYPENADEEATPTRQATAMAFIYPDAATGESGAAEGEDVTVEDEAGGLYLSVGLHGAYDEETLKRGLEKLEAFLADHPDALDVEGPARLLGYNSPFVPWFWQYGEVQLPVGVPEDE